MNASGWISTEEQLPQDRTYVLVHLVGRPWTDHDDQEHVSFAVVKFISDPADCGKGNNRKPYRWHAFGSEAYFGQDVNYWMAIPPLALCTAAGVIK